MEHNTLSPWINKIGAHIFFSLCLSGISFKRSAIERVRHPGDIVKEEIDL